MLGEGTTYHFTTASPGFMSEVQKTSIWCLKNYIRSMVWIERWMAVLHLRRFREYFRVTTAHFFLLRVFFLLWSYLCCRTDVGFMTFYFHYFLFIIVQCSHDLSDKIWFFNWVWSRQPNAFRFSTGILYNAFRFNIRRQIMTIECMTTILIYKELDNKNYEYGNPKAWIKHEWI